MNLTHNFGDPFLVLLGAEETAAQVRVRVQRKLGLSDEEIAKWKLAVVSFGRVEYLEDDEVVKHRFRKHDNYGNWDDYLGLEHAQCTRLASSTRCPAPVVARELPFRRRGSPHASATISLVPCSGKGSAASTAERA